MVRKIVWPAAATADLRKAPPSGKPAVCMHAPAEDAEVTNEEEAPTAAKRGWAKLRAAAIVRYAARARIPGKLPKGMMPLRISWLADTSLAQRGENGFLCA